MQFLQWSISCEKLNYKGVSNGRASVFTHTDLYYKLSESYRVLRCIKLKMHKWLLFGDVVTLKNIDSSFVQFPVLYISKKIFPESKESNIVELCQQQAGRFLLNSNIAFPETASLPLIQRTVALGYSRLDGARYQQRGNKHLD